MSALKKLSKDIRTQELRLHPDGQKFSCTFPVIQKSMQTKQGWSIGVFNTEVEEIIREYGDVQRHRTNVKAHMTNWFMHQEYDQFKVIADCAIDLAEQNSPHQVLFSVFDCWGAIYKKNDWTKAHDHWPSPWSFVYYVASDGETPLSFPDAQDVQVIPKTGDMVMFPGWIRHSVPKHESDKKRIVVAGNLYIQI